MATRPRPQEISANPFPTLYCYTTQEIEQFLARIQVIQNAMGQNILAIRQAEAAIQEQLAALSMARDDLYVRLISLEHAFTFLSTEVAQLRASQSTVKYE